MVGNSLFCHINSHYSFFVEIAIIRDKSDVEVIAIVNDSISHLISSIPSLPYYGFHDRMFYCGTQLPNGDLLLAGGGLVRYGGCGRYIGPQKCYKYHHYREGSIHWSEVGTMKMARNQYASVLIDGCLLTTGGNDSYTGDYTSHLEKFSFAGGVEEKKKMPIALSGHTATIFGKHKMLICGGQTSVRRFVVKHFLNYKNKKQIIQFTYLSFCFCGVL